MIVSENVREALSSLWASKQRTLLALLGIVIGIGSVIAMVSVGAIVQAEALRQFKDMGTDIIRIAPKTGPRNKSRLSLADAGAIPENCPEIVEVAPYISANGTIRTGGNSIYAPALGVTGNFFSMNKLRLAEGRRITVFDGLMYYCVLGAELRDALAKAGMRSFLGEQILYSDRLFTVVGVLESVPFGTMRPDEINGGLLIPAATSMRFANPPSVSTIQARIRDSKNWKAAGDQVRGYLRARVKGVEYKVTSAEELIGRMQEQMRMFTLLLGAIGSISLVVGGVGVMNVMLVSVSERRREIGIRRAIGAQRTDIQTQFLVESVILCVTGGLAGMVLGVGVSYGLSRINGWEFMICEWAMALGVAVSFAVGVFFGFYPARQAARLSPIDALRSG